jgi:hypothetical protein
VADYGREFNVDQADQSSRPPRAEAVDDFPGEQAGCGPTEDSMTAGDLRRPFAAPLSDWWNFEQLERAGFVVVEKPLICGGAALGRGLKSSRQQAL